MSERVLVNWTGIRNFDCTGIKQLRGNELGLGDRCWIVGNGRGLLAAVWFVLFHIKCRIGVNSIIGINWRSDFFFSSGFKCIHGNVVSVFGRSSNRQGRSNVSWPNGEHRCCGIAR